MPPTDITAARRLQRGITFIELLVVLAIAAVVAVIGNQVYADYVEDARRRAMIGEIKRVEVLIERFRSDNGRLPDALAELGISIPRDPFGSPLAYLKIEGAPPAVRGQVRKDRNLVPINSDYDLYSKGADGESQPPLTVPVSHDDVVRAGNGGFVGLASEF